MSYRQLFLLILTIWTAELFGRLLFDVLLPPQMDYMTYYLPRDSNGVFRGRDLPEELGDRGWQLVSVLPSAENDEEVILFLQRQRFF